jgi:hypothetical protein
MSKIRSIPYAVLSGALLVGGGASAQSMYDIDRRQDYQQNRIERGIQDGQITRSEAYRLEQGERAIDRAQARARADGVITPEERARIDRMTDRESREIYRDSHNNQQAWDRGQQWGHTDGRYDGWRDRNAGRDGWGNHNGGNWGGNNNWGDRGGDPGQHYGWNNGQHNGWDGNRPSGIERRDASAERRIDNGIRDGSLTRGEANRLERGQDRIDRYEARARSDGNVSPYERGRIDQMQNNESRRIYEDRHNDRTASNTPPTGSQVGGSQTGNSRGNGWNHQPGSNGGGTQTGGTQTGGTQTGSTQPSHGWGNGGWQHQQGGQTTAPTAGNQPTQQPTQQPTHSWGNNGGWQRPQQASAPTQQQPTQQPQRTWGGNNGGFRMQQASITPQTPRPTYTPTSNPTNSSSRGYRR